MLWRKFLVAESRNESRSRLHLGFYDILGCTVCVRSHIPNQVAIVHIKHDPETTDLFQRLDQLGVALEDAKSCVGASASCMVIYKKGKECQAEADFKAALLWHVVHPGSQSEIACAGLTQRPSGWFEGRKHSVAPDFGEAAAIIKVCGTNDPSAGGRSFDLLTFILWHHVLRASIKSLITWHHVLRQQSDLSQKPLGRAMSQREHCVDHLRFTVLTLECLIIVDSTRTKAS